MDVTPHSQNGLANLKGLEGETLALEYLEQQGLVLVQRNYRCKLGEIDLIMRDKDTLIFVEVKLRKSDTFGSAAAMVTHAKQKKLLKAARHFMMYHPATAQCDMRFDVVGITQSKRTCPIDWIQHAFTGSVF